MRQLLSEARRHHLAPLSMVPVLLWAAVAHAGLIIEVAPDLDAHIAAARLEGDEFQFDSSAGTRRIVVPDGTAELILEWAQHYDGGPLVFSIDGALVPSVRNSYAPPSLPDPLSQLMFEYDSYAHLVACGGLPSQRTLHPMIRRGAREQLPGAVYRTLLDRTNRAAEAVWYRHLAARFDQPPSCVGQLSFRVDSAARPGATNISVNSWLHTPTLLWYRPTDVPSEWDRWAARLPYRFLKRDIETHWNQYQETFGPLRELTAIVEVFALLQSIKQNAPAVWTALIQNAEAMASGHESNLNSTFERMLEAREHIGIDELDAFDSRRWRELSQAWLGEHVDTPAQANLALQLAQADELSASWQSDIEGVAATDPRLFAKLQLYKVSGTRFASLLRDPSQVTALFASLHQDYPDNFRLRAFAVGRLSARLSRVLNSGAVETNNLNGLRPLLRDLIQEHAKLGREFIALAEPACRTRSLSTDVVFWEDLSRDVYSVGLLDNDATPALIRAVACMHRARGLAHQVGLELFFRHAHYRFLGYLGGLRQVSADSDLASTIDGYRRSLAQAIGLPEGRN
jgi:hypothetical protein